MMSFDRDEARPFARFVPAGIPSRTRCRTNVHSCSHTRVDAMQRYLPTMPKHVHLKFMTPDRLGGRDKTADVERVRQEKVCLSFNLGAALNVRI